MPYHIAGIDVHKKMLAIAVADVEVEDDYHFERLKVGTNPVQLRALHLFQKLFKPRPRVEAEQG